MSDPFVFSPTGEEPAHPALSAAAVAQGDEERPPSCPSCNRRLVILATHWQTNPEGKSVRRQLWGCPRGHAVSYRMGGLFTPIELLPDVTG